MSLTDIEREIVDAMKRHQKILTDHNEKYRIINLAEIEFSGLLISEDDQATLDGLSVEDRTLVDSAKTDLQKETDDKAREAELLAIALTELEEE